MSAKFLKYGIWILIIAELLFPVMMIGVGCVFMQFQNGDAEWLLRCSPLVLILSGIVLLAVAFIDLLLKRPRDLFPDECLCVALRNEKFPGLSRFINGVSMSSRSWMSPQLVAFTGETSINVGIRFPYGPLCKGIVVLRIGKPLMNALSLVEFEAILVHELAHKLGSDDFRLYSWLFDRSRISILDSVSRIVFPARHLLRQKYVEGLTIRQAIRLNEELSCDSESIRAVGEVGFAMALVSSYRVKQAVSNYLPNLLLRSVRQSRMVWEDYIRRVDELVRNGLDRNESIPLEAECMSHPSLTERLSQTALCVGDCNRGSIPIKDCASFQLLGSASVSVDHYLERLFKLNAKRSWEEWHNYVCCSSLDDNILFGKVFDALAW